MDYTQITGELFRKPDTKTIRKRLIEITQEHDSNERPALESCFSCLDLTSLGPEDSSASITAFAGKASSLKTRFPELPVPATVCVYPLFVEDAGLALGESEIGITAVCGAFPHSKTFLEVKMLECAMAEESGADELDIVLNLGAFFDGNDNIVANEIEVIRKELADETLLKVILETGLLPSPADIRKAAVLAMAGGAGMIKTSTGKNGTGATPEAVYILCEAIRDFYEYTGTRVGIKVAGGVGTTNDALLYRRIVSHVLGEEWLIPQRFRIGASSLANALISSLTGTDVTIF